MSLELCPQHEVPLKPDTNGGQGCPLCLAAVRSRNGFRMVARERVERALVPKTIRRHAAQTGDKR